MNLTFEKPPEQLRREDIERQTIEAVAQKLEQRAGNSLYMQAWRAAAKFIRSLKS